MADKIIIIGDGVASVSAIKAIREVDDASEIHLFGENVFYPYNRVRLSKGLLSVLQEDKILLQKREWYDDNRVNLYLGTKVESIDIDKKVIKVYDDSLISYTKLLIASGSRNKEPDIAGIKLPGVYNLRTLQDAWDIMEESKENNEILIMGGGVQGLEVAWAMAQIDKKVTIAQHSNRLMGKQLDEVAAKILEKAIKDRGVEILYDTCVSEILGEKEVEGFKTADGKTFTCDTVIYSIGTEPNIDLVKDTPIKTDRGIIVDERMETNIEGIYAAGDVAQYHDHIFGLWNIAQLQGKVAGYNIGGKDTVYELTTPMTTLNTFGLSLFSMGRIDESEATNILLEDKTQGGKYSKILIKNNRVIGGIVVGNMRASQSLKAAIEKDIFLSDINENMSLDELIQSIKKTL